MDIINGCSVTGCLNLHESGPTCAFHMLSEADQRRVIFAEDVAQVADPDGTYFCFICCRSTDHSGEHEPQQYLDWLNDNPQIERPPNWPTAEQRMVMAIFGPTDADRYRLSLLGEVSDRQIPAAPKPPSPADVARKVAIRKAEERAMELSLARLADAASSGKMNRCWRDRG